MKTILKWVLRIALALILILVIAGFTMVMIGSSKAGKVYQVDGLLTSVSADSMSLARGEHLSNILACRHCHGADLSGQVLGDAPPFFLAASNITSGNGGVVTNYTVEDWDRAIRHGLRPDGTPILIMPSKSYNKISDEDAGHLIAYLQTADAVNNEVPPASLKPMGKMILATGAPLFETALGTTDVQSPPAGATLEYGSYLGSVICQGCHGESLEGGPGADPNIPASSLEAASHWDMESFMSTLRTGQKPNGDTLSITMPFDAFQHLTDDEAAAIHMFVQSTFE